MKADELNEDKIADLKKEHGDILEMYELPDGDVLVIRPPSDFVWGKWLREGTDEKGRGKAIESLALSCMAAPSLIEGKAALKKYPAAPLSILEIVTRLGGGGGDTKKL